MLSNLKADLCGDMYRALPCLMWTLGALALRPESPVGTAWSWPLVTGTEEETPFLPIVKLWFSAQLVPRDSVEGARTWEPDLSLAT